MSRAALSGDNPGAQAVTSESPSATDAPDRRPAAISGPNSMHSQCPGTGHSTTATESFQHLKASYIPVHTCPKRRQVRPDKQPREARHRKLERPIVAAIELPSAGLRRPSWPIGRSKLSYREQQGLPLHALTTGHDIPPSNSVPTCPQKNSGSLVKSETHQINSMRATAGLS